MNVSKMIICDLKNGIIHNKRYYLVPVLIFFECMYSDNLLRILSFGQSFGKPTIFDLLILVFRGCDPISKLPKDNSIPDLPYFWIAIFIFSVFCGFDYMHDDLTQFGTQIITRCKKRRTWWNSKCIWCIVSSFYFYLLTILTIILYGALHDYEFVFENNHAITNAFAGSSLTHKLADNNIISTFNKICLVIAPYLVICTLNMIQMILCLYLKPIFSYIIPSIIIMAATYTDSSIIFTRFGMLLYTQNYFVNGYSTFIGIVICLLIIIMSIIWGEKHFKVANILPDKE